MSQQSLDISMRSKKHTYDYGMNVFKLSFEPDYSDNLKRSSDFYEEWGNKQFKFDDWWKEHKYLFDDLYVKEINKVSNSPNVINLSIPLNEKVSVITNDVKRIVEKRRKTS